MICVRRVRLVIEGEIPPTVNHYKVPIIIRGHISFKVTIQAKLFKTLVAYSARKVLGAEGRGCVRPLNANKLRYRLRLVVYLGKKQRGDIDNFWKVVMDGLKDCGAIHSDDAVFDHHGYKRRDRDRPRTEITVWSYMAEKVGQ